MEQVFYRVHVRTVSVWCAIAGPKTRHAIEKIALISSLISICFLSFMHYNFVGNNINTDCFLNEMNTNLTTMKSYDIINIHISRDWSKYHSDNIGLFDIQKYGPLIYEEFTNLMGLHYDESSKNENRLDSRSILNSVLNQLQEAISANPSSLSTLSSSKHLLKTSNFEKSCENQNTLSSTSSPTNIVSSLPQFESLLYDRVYLYSSEKAYLMLPPNKRKRHNITTYDLILPTTCKCFGIAPVSFAIYNLIGYDTIMINLMNKLYNGKGQIYNIYSKQIFTIDTFTNNNNNNNNNNIKNNNHFSAHSSDLSSINSNSHDYDNNNNQFKFTNIIEFIQAFIGYLFYKSGLVLSCIFLFFTMTTIVSYILNQTQSKMLKFTFLLQYHVRHNIPYGTVVLTHVVESLVFVPIMVGILFFLFEFFRDQLLSFLILSLIWTCEVYSVMSVRTYLSMRYFPRIIFLYFCLLHLYLFSFPLGFSYLALYANYSFDFHLMLYFFNYVEMPAYEAGQISAIRPRYMYPVMNSTNPLYTNNINPTPPNNLNNSVGFNQGLDVNGNILPTINTINDEISTQQNELNTTPRVSERNNNTSLQMNTHSSSTLNNQNNDNNSNNNNSNNNNNNRNNRETESPIIRTPLEEIEAAEREIANRQRLQSRELTSSDLSSSNNITRSISDESTTSQFDSAGLLYGISRAEELSQSIISPTNQIELSREIQRQQLAVEMSFELPTIPSSHHQSNNERLSTDGISTTLPLINEEVSNRTTTTTSTTLSSSTSSSTQSSTTTQSNYQSPPRNSRISSFFSNIFHFNKTKSHRNSNPEIVDHELLDNNFQTISTSLLNDQSERNQEEKEDSNNINTTISPPSSLPSSRRQSLSSPITSNESKLPSSQQLQSQSISNSSNTLLSPITSLTPSSLSTSTSTSINNSQNTQSNKTFDYTSIFNRRRSLSLFSPTAPSNSSTISNTTSNTSITSTLITSVNNDSTLNSRLFRPRSQSEDLSSLSQSTNIELNSQQQQQQEQQQIVIMKTNDLKSQVHLSCDLYNQKERKMNSNIKENNVVENSTIKRSNSAPSIMTKLTLDELICPLTPNQIQQIRRRRKNIGNYSSDMAIAAITRARAMSGTSSIGDNKSEIGSIRDRSQSNVSIQSNISSGYSIMRERGNSDRSMSGGRYLTPQQQQLQQRKLQQCLEVSYQDIDNDDDCNNNNNNNADNNADDNRNNESKEDSPIVSLTTSIYNLIIQSVIPTHNENENLNNQNQNHNHNHNSNLTHTSLTSESITSQIYLRPHSNSHPPQPRSDRSDSNTTTNTSSTSSQNLSDPISTYPPSLLSRNHEIINRNQIIEDDPINDEEWKDMEEFYQENQDFSVFGVHLDDDDDDNDINDVDDNDN